MEEFSNYNFCIFQSKKVSEELFEDTIKLFREVVATWKGHEEYLPKLDNLAENIAEIGQKCYLPNKLGFGYNVLNHGDFNMRNILVKNNQQKELEDFRFVKKNSIEKCK